MFGIGPLVLVDDGLVRHAKSVSVEPCIEVGCILDLQVVSNLVLDVIPVLLLNMIENLHIVSPINALVFKFGGFSHFLKVTKTVAYVVLLERYSLAQLLEDLEPRRQLHVAIHIESHRGLEASGRYNLHTTILFGIGVKIQVLNIIDWAQKLLFSRPKHGHTFDIVQVAVNILGLRQRIANGLV